MLLKYQSYLKFTKANVDSDFVYLLSHFMSFNELLYETKSNLRSSQFNHKIIIVIGSLFIIKDFQSNPLS